MTRRAITISQRPNAPSTPPRPGNDRYQVRGLLGRGGMALVYDATDRAADRQVALKRLQAMPEPAKQQRNLELFEREFHTLSQLAHPRIVRVYDFGIDDSGAYYTMELLDGGDLQELAPLPWRRACAIARDVCSALSLVHSRRFVHRDVSPRNVRCQSGGLAKLIDFGAMAPVGPAKLLVGTPPCCAPESVHLQSIDGRTDLFSLGATLYYTLVGQHAFPARQFAGLAHVWRAGFARPSELVPDIPAELDALVVDLLRLEPDARPASAAEVMERLSAIDGETASEQLTVARAYLATPTLVGRDAALERVRRRVNRATGGRSRSVVITGAQGVGRTRFLDACLLDATLTGQLIARADSDDAVSGDYGVVRALARQLLAAVPELTRETAAPVYDRLATLLPELSTSPPPANDVFVPRAHLQRALHAWLTSLSKRQPFVLAVDDFHRIDEPSAALIALLECDSTEHELCLLITVEAGATWTAESARKLLQPLTTLQLDALSEEDSERLLRSVFGSVPNLELLAHRLRELCAGSPRDLLRLAQHLVDRGTARYTSGEWTLPREIDPTELPASLSDALALRIAALPEPARELACAFALCPDQAFSFEECGLLSAATEPAARVGQLEALIGADVVRRLGEDVALSQPSWVPLLRATLSRTLELTLERRLALLFEQRRGQEFRAAQHWFRAGESTRALDQLVVHAELSQEVTARGPEIFLRYLLGLPEAWFETFTQGLRSCDELQRPAKQQYALLSRVVGIMALLNAFDTELFEKLLVHLRRDSGYDDWHALSSELDPQQRLATALGRAQARYDAQPEQERVLDPASAIRGLVLAVMSAAGPASMALDVAALRALPQLALFAKLSPALDVSSRLIEGVIARGTGRIPQARRVYVELQAILARPDRAGLEESYAAYVELGVMNGLGMIDAGLGLRSALEWADKLTNSPAYEVNAQVIRMLDSLFQGNVAAAEQHKHLADRLRIQNSGRQMYEGGHLIWEVQAHAMSGDLTRVRHASEDIARLAKRYPHWVPVLRYATAEYHRMTRDFERACADLEQVMSAVSAGSHQIWPDAARTHVLVLLELGRHDAALACGRAYAISAERELEFVPEPLQLALGLARAHAGETDAGASIDALIQRLQDAGISGLHLGVAHETRARIALHQQDMSGFARHVDACAHIFLAHKSSALTAKYHRLLNEGRRNLTTVQERSGSTPDSAANYDGTRIELALASCRDEDQRARLALTLLIRRSSARGGLLYLVSDTGPFCVAQVGNTPEPSELSRLVRDYLAAQLAQNDLTSTESQDQSSESVQWSDSAGRVIRPILLSHQDGDALTITGIAAMVVGDSAAFNLPLHIAVSVSRFYAAKGATSLILQPD